MYETFDAYQRAISVHNLAIHEYQNARDKYRSRLIDDAEFQVAMDKYKAANKAFDRAYDHARLIASNLEA